MNLHGIQFDADQLADFCRKHHVARLSVFGSILREDFGPTSDIDLLVEFEPDQTPGMVGFGSMILELSKMLGRQVDLRTPQDLSRHFRPFVLREAMPLQCAA